uniref:Ig-like domain-containing protein n=1 Tax=Xiphophorus couchianus TaxID=32473 RepID=A0A3B5LI46_9TELE
ETCKCLFYILFMKLVEVNEGAEPVLLPCIYSDNPLKDPLLTWTRSDLSPNSVHLRREFGDDLKNQNQRFRNRTSMNPDALDTGNFSLTLRKPQQSDGGNYTCSISNGRQELNLKQVKGQWYKCWIYMHQSVLWISCR